MFKVGDRVKCVDGFGEEGGCTVMAFEDIGGEKGVMVKRDDGVAGPAWNDSIYKGQWWYPANFLEIIEPVSLENK